MLLQKCKICRREGQKLLLKGERCLTTKCAFTRRAYAPGEHGQSFHGKQSEYGKQLREKQKARRIYGVDETQFSNYVDLANTMVGNNAENLLKLLELRLDNIIFRLGFAGSRAQSRQYSAHGLFKVNDHTVTVPSYLVKIGDVIKPKNKDFFKEIEGNKSNSWLEFDEKKLSGKVIHIPSREEIDTPVNESLIIEFYSR